MTCLDTVDPITGGGSCTLYGRQLVQFFTKIWKEEDLCKVCSTQSYGWVGTCENFFQTCPHILNCIIPGYESCAFQCLCNTKSECRMENKIITMAKSFTCNRWGSKQHYHFLWAGFEFVPDGKKIEQWIQCRGPQKLNEGSFRNEATILRERQLAHFA